MLKKLNFPKTFKKVFWMVRSADTWIQGLRFPKMFFLIDNIKINQKSFWVLLIYQKQFRKPKSNFKNSSWWSWISRTRLLLKSRELTKNFSWISRIFLDIYMHTHIHTYIQNFRKLKINLKICSWWIKNNSLRPRTFSWKFKLLEFF